MSVHATTERDGSAVVVIDGERRKVVGVDLDDARAKIRELALRHAEAAGQPIMFTSNDPDGDWAMLVHPDGRMEAAAHPTAGAALTQPAAKASPAPVITAVDMKSSEARRPTAGDFADSARPPESLPAELGWQAFIRRTTFGLIRPRPGRVEVALRWSLRAVLRGLTGHKVIVVINDKGGVGKTTATYLLCSVLGRRRGGTVLAWDNNENRGTLGQRGIPSSHDHTAIDLLAEIEASGDAPVDAKLLNYVRFQGSNKFDLLASQNRIGTSQVLDATAFGRLRPVLSKFYRMIVVDTGNNAASPGWHAAVAAADQIVIVSTLREDSTRAAAQVADTLWALGHEDKLRGAVTVLSAPSTGPVDRELRARTIEHMGKLTRAVVEVPYDPALAGGTTIEYHQLSQASRDAWLHVAAAVVTGL